MSRFNRTLADEFLYARRFRSENERRVRLKRWFHAHRDGVDQLVEDIRVRRVHRRRLESCDGIDQVESEIHDSYEKADLAARRWLDDHAC